MKRLAAGASLVTLSLSLVVAGRADAQKYPQRMPYDRFDRSRPDRNRIAPPPPVITSVPTPRGVTPAPGVPSREFRLPPDRPSSPFDAGPNTYAPRYAPRYDSTSRPLRPYAYGYGYGYGAAPLYTLENVNTGAPSAEAPFAPGVVESVGRLFIDTEPGTAQVFVDGIAVGAVADFRGVGILLTEGSRHVELRSPGYESAVFDVTIASSQPAVHRGDLMPVRTAAGPAAPVIRRGSDTFYVIPGCYLGNKPPREVSLPRGCDIAKAKTIK
jgi:hypothetical protein